MTNITELESFDPRVASIDLYQDLSTLFVRLLKTQRRFRPESEDIHGPLKHTSETRYFEKHYGSYDQFHYSYLDAYRKHTSHFYDRWSEFKHPLLGFRVQDIQGIKRDSFDLLIPDNYSKFRSKLSGDIQKFFEKELYMLLYQEIPDENKILVDVWFRGLRGLESDTFPLFTFAYQKDSSDRYVFLDPLDSLWTKMKKDKGLPTDFLGRLF